MPESTAGEADGLPTVRNSNGSAVPELNVSLVLVVASSGINRVVVSRIVERTGLRAVSVVPSEAEAAFAEHLPGTVVLDGGATNKDCDSLFATLTNRRMIHGNLPVVVFLSTTNLQRDALAFAHAIDATIAKPITPDSLQPVIRDLTDGHRSGARA